MNEKKKDKKSDPVKVRFWRGMIYLFLPGWHVAKNPEKKVKEESCTQSKD